MSLQKLQAAMDKSGVKPLDSFIWRGHKILNSDGTYSQNEKRLP
jgi:hypothetical protein